MTDIESWRKSTYSSGSSGNCVEVADSNSMIMVRDTKQAHMSHAARTTLAVSADAWSRFVSTIK